MSFLQSSQVGIKICIKKKKKKKKKRKKIVLYQIKAADLKMLPYFDTVYEMNQFWQSFKYSPDMFMTL